MPDGRNYYTQIRRFCQPFFYGFREIFLFCGFSICLPCFPTVKIRQKGENLKNSPEKAVKNVHRDSLAAGGRKREKSLWIFRCFCAIVNTTGKGASASFHPCAGGRGGRPLPALSEAGVSPSSAPTASIGRAPLNPGADGRLRPACSPAGIFTLSGQFTDRKGAVTMTSQDAHTHAPRQRPRAYDEGRNRIC